MPPSSTEVMVSMVSSALIALEGWYQSGIPVIAPKMIDVASSGSTGRSTPSATAAPIVAVKADRTRRRCLVKSFLNFSGTWAKCRLTIRSRAGWTHALPADRANQVRQPVQGGQRRVVHAHQNPVDADEVDQQGDEDLFLAVEVVVQRGTGDAHRAGDVLHPGLGVAALVEQLGCRVQDGLDHERVARLRLGQPASLLAGKYKASAASRPGHRRSLTKTSRS